MSLALRIFGGTLLALLGILMLLMAVRIRIFLDLTSEGFWVRVKAGPVSYTVWPQREKKEKKRKKTAEEHKHLSKEKSSPIELLHDFGQIFEKIKKTLGRLSDALIVDRLEVSAFCGGADPAQAAILYGGTSAAVGLLIPWFESNFRIRDRSVRVILDFEKTRPETDLHAALSIRIAQAVWSASGLGPLLVKLMRKNKKKEATPQ